MSNNRFKKIIKSMKEKHPKTFKDRKFRLGQEIIIKMLQNSNEPE